MSRFLLRMGLRDDLERNDRAYPFSLPAIRGLGRALAFHEKVTFFVGENGSGKSTLLEALAVALGFNAEGGSQNFRFSTRSSESELWKHLRVARADKRPRTQYFLRAESFFNVATKIEELDAVLPAFGPPIIDSYGGRSLHEQSHGESFFALFTKRFGPFGLYLLDEPEAALSPSRQIEVLRRIHQHVQYKGSQFVIATHSPILLAYPEAYLYRLNDEGIQRVTYEDTEHYRVTEDFLRHRERHIEELLRAERDDDETGE